MQMYWMIGFVIIYWVVFGVGIFLQETERWPYQRRHYDVLSGKWIVVPRKTC